jgi:hypothetical protein
MLKRYDFDIRVHSDFKRSVKPNRLYIVVAASNDSEAFSLATATFRAATGASDLVLLRYLSRGYYGSYYGDQTTAGVISVEPRDWTDPRLGGGRRSQTG